MRIRPERKEDFDTIYQLIKRAFETAQVADGTEQDFAVSLRNSDSYIPELALVAEEEGEIIGHIMFTKREIETQSKLIPTLLLAPLCVALEWRNRKVGERLIKEGIRIARKMGYQSVFLVGNPEYYGRFGFVQTTKWNIENKNKIPDQYVLGYEIVAKSLENREGQIELETC